MRSRWDGNHVSRRGFLAGGLAAAGAVGLEGFGLGRLLAAAPESSPYGPFKFGLQSYSLRGYKANGKSDRKKALELTKQLGLHYWEAFPEHIPFGSNASELETIRQQLEAAGVSVNGYGVVPLKKDPEANRKYFEFARAMKISYLSADPAPDSFDTLDKQVEEYGIAIGIHNHGPGHHYAKIDTIAEKIKDHNPKIGCCIDTGHFLRSKEDPVRAAEVFKGRIYGVHLKDVKDAVKFTILGQGDLRVLDLLKVLAAQKYPHIVAVEYEERPEDPMADIEECLKFARATIAELPKTAAPGSPNPARTKRRGRRSDL